MGAMEASLSGRVTHPAGEASYRYVMEALRCSFPATFCHCDVSHQ